MAIAAARGSPGTLRELPTKARLIVDASTVAVPEGYTIEPVVVSLSFPIDLDFGGDGTIFVSEGGSTWPTRPAPPPRILAINPHGEVDEFARTMMPGPRGLAVHDGGLYVSYKGGYFSEIHRFDLETSVTSCPGTSQTLGCLAISTVKPVGRTTPWRLTDPCAKYMRPSGPKMGPPGSCQPPSGIESMMTEQSFGRHRIR